MSSYRSLVKSPPKQQSKDSELQKTQEEMNKGFVNEREIKVVNKENLKLKFELLKHAEGGEVTKIEQLLNAVCRTQLDRRLLIDGEDQYGRSAIFYALYKGILNYIF